MFRSSAAVAALALASNVGLVAADSGCSSVIATANSAGLGALNGALAAATTELLQTEAGPLILGAAQLTNDLPEGQRVTIFAPTDVAFQEAAEKFGGDLPQDALADVLLNHVVPQELTASTIISLLGENGGSVIVSTVLGGELFVSTDGASIFVQSPGLEAPGATVTEADQITCAGPIHVIDTVLLPTMPDGSVVAFPDAELVTPEMAPGLAPGIEDAFGPALTPDGMIPGLAPIEALPPSIVIADGAPDMAPGDAPLDTSTRGLSPLGFFDYADEPLGDEPIGALEPLGDEPTAVPIIGGVVAVEPVADVPTDAPIIGGVEPLGDEPAAGPLDLIEPLGDEPTGVPELADPLEGAEDDLEAGDTANGAPTVQADDTDSAFSSALLSSTVAAVAVAVLAVAA